MVRRGHGWAFFAGIAALSGVALACNPGIFDEEAPARSRATDAAVDGETPRQSDSGMTKRADAATPPADMDASSCTQNACGGCGPLTHARGSSCGECGSYTCDRAKGDVKCVDPGRNACGGCSALTEKPRTSCNRCGTWTCTGADSLTCDMSACTWCEQQTRPTGVAASDYQCLDFDASEQLPGMPWSTQATPAGALGTSSERYASGSRSLRSSTGNNEQGQLIWSVVGAAPVTRLTLRAKLLTGNVPGVASGAGDVNLLCVASKTRSVCLTKSSADLKLHLSESINDQAASADLCALVKQAALEPDVWNDVTLTFSAKGAELTLDGKAVDTSDCTVKLTADTSARIAVGNDVSGTGPGSTLFYDDVSAAISR